MSQPKNSIKCANCQKVIRQGKYCCPQCNKDYKLKELVRKSHIQYPKESPENYVSCPVCDYRSPLLTVNHLRSRHNINSSEEFYKLYPGFIITSLKLAKEYSDKVKGDKNPYYDHGGKLSPFSKKFVKYQNKSEEEVEDIVNSLKIQAKVSMNENGNNPLTLEYYTNRGQTLEEAKESLNDRQSTFSLEKCIERHGVLEGTMIWQDRQDRWQATLDAKPDEEKAEINRKKLYKSGFVSKIEQDLQQNIEKILGEKLESQKMIKRKDTKYFLYDLSFGNKIIEFNGDYWHANPKKYKSGQYISFPRRDNILVDEVWESDKRKINLAKESGYEVLVVWESDYKKNKENIVQECVNFLTK